MHYTVATVNVSGYFVIRNLGSNRYEGVSGIEFELLQILSKHLNFTYELVSPEDQQWGASNENGDWSGMVGMLQKNEADFAIDGIVLMPSRTQVADYAFPYYIDDDSFILKQSGTVSPVFFFVHPFQPLVWGLFITCLLLCSAIFSFLEYFYTGRLQKRDKIFKNTYSMIEILIGSRGFGKFFNNGVSRIFFFLSAFPIHVLLFCFIGLLLSFLMTPIMEYQIKTFEALAKASRSNTVKVTTDKGNYIYPELQEARTGILKDLGNNLRINPEDTPTSDADTIEKAMSDYAYLESRLCLQLLVHEVGLNDEIFISEDSLKMIPIAILFRKDFCCIKNFDNSVLCIYQSGLYQKLLQDQLFKFSLKRKLLVGSTGQVKPITFKDFRAVFVLLILGLAFATAALFYERYSHKWHRKHIDG